MTKRPNTSLQAVVLGAGCNHKRESAMQSFAAVHIAL
jgi:hypothetical protein